MAAIIVLVVAECLFLSAAGWFALFFSHFSLGPLTTQDIQDRVRAALTVLAWAFLNVAGLITFALRHRGWGRWALAAIEAADMGETAWVGVGQLISSCGEYGGAWLVTSAVAAVTLVLLYLLWRLVDRAGRDRAPDASPTRRMSRIAAALSLTRSRGTLAAIGGLMLIGAALIGMSWSMTVQGLEAHSGIVRTAVADQYGLNLTLDSSSRGYYFGAYSFGTIPNIRVGDSVVILTGETCRSGTSVAVQAKGLGRMWIESGYYDSIAPYTPATWQDHEMLRWLLLGLGAAIELLGLFALLLWVG